MNVNDMVQDDMNNAAAADYIENIENKISFEDEKQDEQSNHLFQKEKNFILEIPETSNLNLIPLITHYFYFKEVKAVPLKQIVMIRKFSKTYSRLIITITS